MITGKSAEDIVVIPQLKRAFDVLFSGSLLIILAPFFIIVLVLLFLEHCFRGECLAPVFYSEPRISQGRIFRLIKFNIFKQGIINAMKQNGEFIHTKTLERENGLTKIGYMLKQIYLDELPQLINVIQGDMSMVGPRPANIVKYQELLKKGIITKKVIKAGITGYQQSQKGGASKSNIELDQDYIDFCRVNPPYRIVLFDMRIILRTLLVIMKAEGI